MCRATHGQALTIQQVQFAHYISMKQCYSIFQVESRHLMQGATSNQVPRYRTPMQQNTLMLRMAICLSDFKFKRQMLLNVNTTKKCFLGIV